MEALNKSIRYLPIEIQEKIYKYYVAAKLIEKNKLGWVCVHEQIKGAPYCDELQRVVKMQ